ncbi:MAG: hypothetical protein GY839_10240, partial [candidate division Zixibacteria bacterium]|nr:hypothetical protein [candidate division Zixibacteria bacterium]
MMEILREKPLTRLIFGILFLYLLCVSTAYSQDTLETKRLRIAASIKTVDTLEYPEDHSLLIDVAGNPVGFEVWEGTGKEARRIVYLNAGNRFAVESFLGTLISSRGNTILKYRCEAKIMPTSRASFILYSSEGDVLTTNYNHSTNAVIAMSGDGYFA